MRKNETDTVCADWAQFEPEAAWDFKERRCVGGGEGGGG